MECLDEPWEGSVEDSPINENYFILNQIIFIILIYEYIISICGRYLNISIK